MTIEKLFENSSTEKPFLKVLEERREKLSMATRRKAVWLMGEREENKDLLVKDLDYMKVTPVVVKHISSKLANYNYEPSLLVTFEKEDETRTLGYISIYYKGFDPVEMDEVGDILAFDEVVYDEESNSFVRDPYLQD